MRSAPTRALATVACSASDSFGNTSTGTFDVTVEAVLSTIRSTIGEVRDLLASLEPPDKRIDKAIERLDRALADDYWAGDNELTKKGKKAYGDLRKAVQELEKVRGDHAAIAEAQAEILTDQASLLAQNALDHAIAEGGDPNEIAKAEKEMAKAAEHRADGDLAKAVKDYRSAWERACKALS